MAKNIVIREILPSDKISALVDKINYNFDQLLIAGGGPSGKQGKEGIIGPMGTVGTFTFTAIDIVDKSTELPVNPILPGNPNDYYPVAIGSTTKIGTESKPLRHGDLYIEEGDDGIGKDGDIWTYSIITNNWTKTGNNIKGKVGSTGSAGSSQWTRDTTYTSLGREYLYPTVISGSNKLALGDITTISEVTGASTVNKAAIINIGINASTSSNNLYGIAIGDSSADADKFATITAYSSILQLNAPTYGASGDLNTNSINLSANNKIKLLAGNLKYNENYKFNIGSSLSEYSHYFSGGPINFDLAKSNENEYVRIERSGRSSLILYPTTEGITDRIHILPLASNIIPSNTINGTKNLIIKTGRGLGVGPFSNSHNNVARLSVYGNTIIADPNKPNWTAPGDYSLSVQGRIGIGTNFDLVDNENNSANKNGSNLYIKDSNSSISIQGTSKSSIYLTNSLTWSNEAITNYNNNNIEIYHNYNSINPITKININDNQCVGIGTENADRRLSVNGDVSFLSTDIDKKFEIISDLSNNGSTFPNNRGISIGNGNNDLGYINFYKSDRYNDTYNTSNLRPSFTSVDSSRFNFRTLTTDNLEAYPLMSISGTSFINAAVQIGSEYNLSNSRITGSEYNDFTHTTIHARKFTDNIYGRSRKMTGILLENYDGSDPNTYVPGEEGYWKNDIDFMFSGWLYDGSNWVQQNINQIKYPQARIRAWQSQSSFTGTPAATISKRERATGNLSFYTALGDGSAIGSNNLNEALRITADSLYTNNNLINLYSDTIITGQTIINNNLQINNLGVGININSEANDVIRITRDKSAKIAWFTGTDAVGYLGFDYDSNDISGTENRFRIVNELGQIDLQSETSMGFFTNGYMKLDNTGGNSNIDIISNNNIELTTTTLTGTIKLLGPNRLPNTSNVIVKFGNTDFRLIKDDNTFVKASDKRLKTNIKEYKNSVEDILKLNPIRYNWNEIYEKNTIKQSGLELPDNPTKDEINEYNKELQLIKNSCKNNEIGLIAQDIEYIIPEIIRINRTTGYKSIDYSKLTILLINAIKDQHEQLTEKDLTINKLEERLSKIEALLNI